MGGRKTKQWSKEADQALLSLMQIYGDHKWAEIARQLKEIYNFEFSPNVVLQRWNRLNPKTYKKPWNHEEELVFFENIKKYGDDWMSIQSEMIHRKTHHLRARLNSIFRRTFRRLNLTIGKFKNVNKSKIENIKPAVFMKLLKLAHEPDPEIKEEDKADLYPQVIQSCRKLFLLIEVVFKSENWNDRSLVYQQLLKMTDRDEVQVMLEHLFLLNTMHQVEHSMILPTEKQERQQALNLNEREIMKRHKKMCGVKTWDEADALTEPYNFQSETDEDEIELIDKNLIKSGEHKQEFNQQEISLLKESTLYKTLFHNERKQFYDMYNSALQPKEDNTFLLNYQDVVSESTKKGRQFLQDRVITNQKKILIEKDEYIKQQYKKRKQKIKKEIGDTHEPKQKVQLKLKKIKTDKVTFRDRFTMFRDEDFLKQELEEQQNITNNMLNNPDDLQNLFDEIQQTEVFKKQINQKQEFDFEEEFVSLFGL